MAKSNDEMNILEGGGDDDTMDSPMPGQDQMQDQQEQDQMIQVKQSDLTILQDALTNATQLLSQYAPPPEEEEQPGAQDQMTEGANRSQRPQAAEETAPSV